MTAAIETRALRKEYPAPTPRRGLASFPPPMPLPQGRPAAIRGPIVALDSLDLDIAQGEFFGLLGPNGAGKTTTIGILTTRVRATSGKANVAGADVASDDVRVRQRIGVVPQRPNPDRSLTVIENLEFHAAYFGMALGTAARRGHELLERLGIGEAECSQHQSRHTESRDVVHLAYRQEARLMATPATTAVSESHAPHTIDMDGDRRISTAAVFRALLRRDLRVARRELPYFLVRTLMQPLLVIIVFGFLLPKMGFVRGGYTTALLPGIIAISLALSAVQAVALPMVQDFGWTREIEDRLLAPVPTPLIASEKVIAGALQGLMSAVVVLPIARLIMGPIQGLSVEHILPFIGVTALGALTFSALGLLMGTAIAPQQIGLMFSIIIAPMLMFGCAYYPWRGLDHVPVMKDLVLINPLVYVAEGMRGAITPDVPHMPIAVSASALVFLAGGFWYWGKRTFMRKALG